MAKTLSNREKFVALKKVLEDEFEELENQISEISRQINELDVEQSGLIEKRDELDDMLQNDY